MRTAPEWMRATIAHWIKGEEFRPAWGPWGKRWKSRLPKSPPLWTDGMGLYWRRECLMAHQPPTLEPWRIFQPGDRQSRRVVRVLQQMFPNHILYTEV